LVQEWLKSANQNRDHIYDKLWVIHLKSLNVILWFTYVRNDQLIIGVANYMILTDKAQKSRPEVTSFKPEVEVLRDFLAELIILGDSDSTWQC